ncbi:hypothetical protein [Zavarzinella formosa]|uniref:hypothetical protein n=1 Tax=Zavarzinella formosa TaxID=360055 RepID=UPI0002FF7C99|nr:hypothetical protein [Zavarzinella formosa]
MNILISLILGVLPVAIQDPKMAALVRQLGHQSFAVREAAARELVKAGTAAVPALTAGIKNGDPEVAGRCKQLLPLAASFEWNQKLAAFLKEPFGPSPKGLAGAERFLKITGDTKDTRRLYADMMVTHHAIIESLETGPADVPRQMFEFWRESRDRMLRTIAVGEDSSDSFLTDRGQVAMFLFVRSDPRYDDSLWERNSATMFLLNASRLEKSLVGPEEVPGMKKLFLHWLAAEKRENEMLTAYRIAKEGEMKEAVPSALKAINDTSLSTLYRANLMVNFLTEMGDREHVKNLTPLLAEESGSLGSFDVGDGATVSPLLRDVALGVSVHLAGQKPSEFGLSIGDHENAIFGGDFRKYGFIDPASRDKAQAKWKAWLAKQEPAPKK